MAQQAVFSGNAQHERASAGGDNDRGGLIGRRSLSVAHPSLEGALTQIKLRDLGRHEFCAKALGLASHLTHQLGAHDAHGETGEVFNFCGQHELATRLV